MDGSVASSKRPSRPATSATCKVRHTVKGHGSMQDCRSAVADETGHAGMLEDTNPTAGVSQPDVPDSGGMRNSGVSRDAA